MRLRPLLVSASLLACPFAHAGMRVDGVLDEPEWEAAQVFEDFVVTQPLTYEVPLHPTRVRLASTPEGIAIGFEVTQPASTERRRPITPRDANNPGDRVNVYLDLDGDAKVVYNMTVALSGSVQDGTITNENLYSTDWDGDWQSAVVDHGDRWSVEILVPWSIASMQDSDAPTRRIGILFDRFVGSIQQRSASARASFSLPRYTSEFPKVEIAQYRASVFHVFPYATLSYDFVGDAIEQKVGGDVFWKPSGDFQLTAAINPDFGQVEADELVVNFDAVEVFFSDRRPFFTENQGVFDLRTPDSGLLIYTRRIGGARDDAPGLAAEIDAAVKVNGSLGALTYGVLAAAERDHADDLGSAFYGQRFVYPLGDLQLGSLATYTDRPFLDRDATVHAVDGVWRPSEAWLVTGMVLGSFVDDDGAEKDGSGAWLRAFWSPSETWQHEVEAMHFDRELDFNDMGFQRRASYNELEYTVTRRSRDFAETDPRELVTWSFEPQLRWNDEGDRLPHSWIIARDVAYRGGAERHTDLIVSTSGTDDLISRGNGDVHIEPRLTSFYNVWFTPRLEDLRLRGAVLVLQEGNDDYALQLEAKAEWFVRENFTVDAFLNPRISRDWLIWREGDLLASFEREQIAFGANFNFFPAPRHELRVKVQWLSIDAHDATALRIGARGELVESDDLVEDFTVNNFGIQARYRWTFAPQSDLYAVYSRGGFAVDEAPSSTAPDELFTDALELRDADQVLVKVRYRF